ncbi:MAG: GNAT family N-acetyltransferase [Candidatus Thermoplasmatota archaeon]|nr:GNAT family N-acetyltransferase [Candidatus Thermoplasmatota archaeon]
MIGNREKGFYLVAEHNNAIVGQVMVTYEWSDWRGIDMWWLQSVYVEKEWRRKGIMKKLLEELKRMAYNNNVFALRLYVYNDNHNAIHAYEKVGMKWLPYQIFLLEL